MKIPISFDLTPEGKIVETIKLGEDGYNENVNYTLVFQYTQEDVHVDYYGDDDTYLSYDHPELHKKFFKSLLKKCN